MIMSAASPPQCQNEAVAQAHLELLSNTALLKKVMDSEVSSWKQQAQQRLVLNSAEKPKKSTIESSSLTTPPKVEKAVVALPPASTMNGDNTSTTTASPTTTEAKGASTRQASEVPKAGEKSSSSPVVMSPVEQQHPRVVFVPPSTSYASLLLPGGPAPAPAAALSHHQFQQTLALAHHHLPQNVKTAMAMMASHPPAGHHQSKIYGGPSSAFQKPYILLKENVPPYHHSVQSPIISRQTSPTLQSPGETSSTREGSPSAYEVLLQENRRLQQEMKQKDETIASLQTKADGLEKQIFELRQLPTGKISHIPIEDMIRIMQEYGSEVSNQTLPKRKQPIQKASIVRQFRRWNPEFFRFFVHVNGEWVPRLGMEGELKRRAEKRRSIQKNKRATSPDSAQSSH